MAALGMATADDTRVVVPGLLTEMKRFLSNRAMKLQVDEYWTGLVRTSPKNWSRVVAFYEDDWWNDGDLMDEEAGEWTRYMRTDETPYPKHLKEFMEQVSGLKCHDCTNLI